MRMKCARYACCLCVMGTNLVSPGLAQPHTSSVRLLKTFWVPGFWQHDRATLNICLVRSVKAISVEWSEFWSCAVGWRRGRTKPLYSFSNGRSARVRRVWVLGSKHMWSTLLRPTESLMLCFKTIICMRGGKETCLFQRRVRKAEKRKITCHANVYEISSLECSVGSNRLLPISTAE